MVKEEKLAELLEKGRQALAGSGWQIRSRIGGGGQAQVYTVSSSDYESVMAAKICFSQESAQVERFRREVEVLSTIDHPNVIPVVMSSFDQTPFFVMPQGESFEEHVRRLRQGTETLFLRSLELMTQLVDGLAAIHRTGHVHRDIKPANIVMLKRNGKKVPVLVDLGLSFAEGKEPLSPLDPIRKQEAQIRYRFAPGYQPRPSDDCLDLMAIWAWMIREDDRVHYACYHWRHHGLITDERILLVRAIWAAASEEELAPVDAAGLGELIKGYFDTSVTSGFEEPRLSDAIVAGLAAAQLETASLHERLEALCVWLEPAVADFLDGLAELERYVIQAAGGNAQVRRMCARGQFSKLILETFKTVGTSTRWGVPVLEIQLVPGRFRHEAAVSVSFEILTEPKVECHLCFARAVTKSGRGGDFINCHFLATPEGRWTNVHAQPPEHRAASYQLLEEILGEVRDLVTSPFFWQGPQ